MKIIIKTKNVELTGELQSYIEEKFLSLEKFINTDLAEITVEVGKETEHHKNGDIFIADAEVGLPGKNLLAQAKADDLFKAIILAKDELKSEIEKYKFKKIDKNRREQRKSKKDIVI